MKAENKNGIQELLKVFNERKDLQTAFPEVWEGNLQNLLEWALKYGTQIDASASILSPYLKDFSALLIKGSENGYTWDNSNEHYILDGFKIYWETLALVASYQFECISGDKNIDLLSHVIQTIKNNFSGRKIRGAFIGCNQNDRPEIKLYETGMFSEIVVMDIAKGLLDEQQKKAHAENITQVIYRQADFNTLVLQEDEFDYINAWGTIHHIKELEHFFHQIRKALKKDGIMVIREYVGPDYLQFTDLQLRMVNTLLAIIPEELRMFPNQAGVKQTENRINKKKLMRMDPSESVRSSDIIKVMHNFMEVIEYRETGGTILHPLVNGIAGNFEKSPEGEGVLQALIDMEKALIQSRMLPSDYVYMVVRPAK